MVKLNPLSAVASFAVMPDRFITLMPAKGGKFVLYINNWPDNGSKTAVQLDKEAAKRLADALYVQAYVMELQDSL